MVVTKANGEVRLCIDSTPLNKALQRDHFSMPTIDDVLPKLANAKVFSSCDLSSAFWHIQLDEESSNLTTFMTPLEKLKFLRLAYGLSPAPEIFQRKLLEAPAGLNGVACIADDILIYGCGDSVELAQQDHDRNMIALLDRCRDKGIKLNKEKMKLNCASVTFMGHELTSDGLRPDRRKAEAIQRMPAPVDRQGLLRLLGMATFLARFCPSFSETTAR